MKSIIFAGLMAIASACSAEAVLVANATDGSREWWGYPETVTVFNDGYSAMFGIRQPQTSTAEIRVLYGVMKADCSNGFGTLYVREHTSNAWVVESAVSIKGSTVADIIAREVCDVGKTVERIKRKDKPKKLSTT